MRLANGAGCSIPILHIHCCYLSFSCFCAEDFHLTIDGGEFTDSEIIVMLGENGKNVLFLFLTVWLCTSSLLSLSLCLLVDYEQGLIFLRDSKASEPRELARCHSRSCGAPRNQLHAEDNLRSCWRGSFPLRLDSN